MAMLLPTRPPHSTHHPLPTSAPPPIRPDQAHVEKAEASAAQERVEVVRQAEMAAKVQIDAVIEAAEMEKAAAFGAAAEATARLEETMRVAAEETLAVEQVRGPP